MGSLFPHREVAIQALHYSACPKRIIVEGLSIVAAEQYFCKSLYIKYLHQL
jgi:hypothetical protein